MIRNIDVTKLCPHPDNPRNELGDLAELAESIKARGVMQNLTVVPYLGEVTGEPIEGVYRVIIGHRRLAAAKRAGLKEVPCAIVEMTPQEQIATMLLENMQRSDLTICEQAQGFQMMLDLGETMNGIAKQTGFSESTVRRRVKLLELDRDKFNASVKRGATLMDYAELDKINDIERKNRVLGHIGTNNFSYELKRAMDEETAEKNRPEWIKVLNAFATAIEDTNNMRWVANYSTSENPDGFKVPEDVDTVEYFYKIFSYGSISVYKIQGEQNAEEIRKEELGRRMMERSNLLEEASARAFELRKAFVSEFTGAKKKAPAIMEFAVRCNLSDDWSRFDDALFAELMHAVDENGDYKELAFQDIEAKYTEAPERVFFLWAYCLTGDGPREKYYKAPWNSWPEHDPNDDLDNIYAGLVKLGYQMSDEEKALADGTHELFSEDGK